MKKFLKFAGIPAGFAVFAVMVMERGILLGIRESAEGMEQEI